MHDDTIDGDRLVRFHDRTLDCGVPPIAGDGLWHWIALDHACNTALADAPQPDDALARQRLTALEAIDGCLLAELPADGTAPPAAWRSGETPGAMIDRLSQLALQLRRLRLASLRTGNAPIEALRCSAGLERLMFERSELRAALDGRLEELAGAAQARVEAG